MPGSCFCWKFDAGLLSDAHNYNGSGNYTVSLDGDSAGGRDQWRYCSKCQMVAFDGNTAWAGGGAHISAGSGNYALTADNPTSGQNNWKRCNKCYGPSYAGNPSLGPCPRTGMHDHNGSGNYSLLNQGATSGTQDRWAWCSKCQLLWYTGNGAARCLQSPLTYHESSAEGPFSS